jgi:hypothetical protein
LKQEYKKNMATGRKLVSDVRSMHKLLSTDSLLQIEVILSEIKCNIHKLKRNKSKESCGQQIRCSTIPLFRVCEVPFLNVVHMLIHVQ